MTPTIPALAAPPLGTATLFLAPAVAAGVAEVDRAALLLADARERVAAAENPTDAVHAHNTAVGTAAGFEVAVSRLCHTLRTEAARTVRAATARPTGGRR